MNITIKPLGGVGQIGSNSTLFSDKKSNIIVDAGILFPNDSNFDINYLIPDLSKVEEKIDAIIITHGHEDHIGAISHFIEYFPEAKIYAPKFARALIISKLNHKNINKEITLLPERLTIGSFEVCSIHVNHSIPDTKGLVINHGENSILFISDFKLDNENIYEKYFDFNALKEFSTGSFKIAMLDSTNIRSKTLHTPSESSVQKDLEKIILETERNCFVTTFASNVHRVQTIINICKKHGLACIPYGPSMKRYIEIAQDLDMLNTFDVIFEPQDKSIKRKKVIIATGSQGEFRGATTRIATGNDKHFKLTENDSFIFSSKAIPGNEKTLANLYNKITKTGANIYTSDSYQIHVSGHPGKKDLADVYEAFKPNIAIPIHGESFFIKDHKEFVLDNNYAEQSFAIENFDQISINNKKVKITQSEEIPPLIIHGNDLEIEREKISERRKLATLGVVFISLSKKSVSYTTMGIPNISDQDNELFIGHLKELNSSNKESDEEVRIYARRFFGNLLGYRPIAVVQSL